MGSQTTKQTTKNQINAQSASERQAMESLLQGATSAGQQMGDLSAIAGGDMGMPTAYDQQLVEQSIGASTDIAERELRRRLEEMMAQYGEQMSARGIQGSSIEAMGAGQIYSGGLDQLANIISQGQGQGATALMNLPMQRAQTQIGANQALFQRLVGGAQPVMQAGLTERLNTMTTQTKTQKPIDWANIALRGAAAYKTMGMSEVARAGQSPSGPGSGMTGPT